MKRKGEDRQTPQKRSTPDRVRSQQDSSKRSDRLVIQSRHKPSPNQPRPNNPPPDPDSSE